MQVLSTFLFALELYHAPAQWYIVRQRLLPHAETPEQILGIKPATYFFERWLGSLPLRQLQTRFEKAEWGCTVAAVIAEDGFVHHGRSAYFARVCRHARQSLPVMPQPFDAGRKVAQ